MLSAVAPVHVQQARRASPRCARGFSLVELMVAMVLGLIVSAAVLALVVAIIHSNRQTLQGTRLNQELRATLALVANDLRRARSVDDPLSVAMAPGGNPYMAVSTATAGCIVYAYDAGDDAPVDGPWRVVRLDAGRVVLEATATRPPGCASAGTPVVLGSPQVEITDLRFSPATTATVPPTATDETLVRTIQVTVTGKLVDDDPTLDAISRTLSQTVYVRSLGTGT